MVFIISQLYAKKKSWPCTLVGAHVLFFILQEVITWRKWKLISDSSMTRNSLFTLLFSKLQQRTDYTEYILNRVACQYPHSYKVLSHIAARNEGGKQRTATSFWAGGDHRLWWGLGVFLSSRTAVQYALSSTDAHEIQDAWRLLLRRVELVCNFSLPCGVWFRLPEGSRSTVFDQSTSSRSFMTPRLKLRHTHIFFFCLWNHQLRKEHVFSIRYIFKKKNSISGSAVTIGTVHHVLVLTTHWTSLICEHRVRLLRVWHLSST